MFEKLKQLFKKLNLKIKCFNCQAVVLDDHIEFQIDVNDELAVHLDKRIKDFTIGKNNTLRISFI